MLHDCSECQYLSCLPGASFHSEQQKDAGVSLVEHEDVSPAPATTPAGEKLCFCLLVLFIVILGFHYLAHKFIICLSEN